MNDKIEFDVIDEHGPQPFRATFGELSAREIAREEVSGLGSVTIEGEARPGDAAGEYIVDGRAAFTADLTCSRCVDAYPFASNSDFHVRFRPRREASRENEEIEIADPEELDVEFYTERAVSLRDLALEQIQLSIPMKPLCDENCLGLCPTCGANRSREDCSCSESLVDERWGALKAIREDLTRKKDV